MDAQLRDDLEYDFANRWRRDIANPFFVALSDRLGEDFPARLVHPVGEGDDVAFLVVSDGGRACLARFEPPLTTTFSFLGPLAGGKYTETVRSDDQGKQEVEGVFEHLELSGYTPLRITVGPPPHQGALAIDEMMRARERSEQLLEQFRTWAAQPAYQTQ